MTTNTMEQLTEAKKMLAEIIGGSLGSAEGYIPTLGYPKTRDIQRRMAALGITEIVYQPGTWLEHKGPVLPPAD